MNEPREDMKAFVDRLGITMEKRLVSTTYTNQHTSRELRAHTWSVKLSRSGHTPTGHQWPSIVTEYHANTWIDMKTYKATLGSAFSADRHWAKALKERVTVYDVVHCLISDAQCFVFADGLDDFFATLGMEPKTPSEFNKQMAIYHACENTARELRGLFSTDYHHAIHYVEGL